VAGSVSNSSQSFAFRDNAATLTVGTVAASGPFAGATGVSTSLGNGDITLANTSGDLVVNQAVSAGTGTVRLSFPAGGVSQTVAGVITAGGLGVIAANAVTLTSAANAVGTLAGSVTNTGQAFSFNNTSRDLVVGTIPAAGFFTGATGVATTNGDLVLKTTTFGNIALNQNVSAGTANAALTAAGNLSETGGAIITANELIANAGGSVALDNGNLVNCYRGVPARPSPLPTRRR
jgi:hypothetical protein